MESVSRVIGKAERSDGTWYYLDDGVYNSYSGQIYDHATYPLTVFSDGECSSIATLAGPTCDSIDVIAEQVNLPPLRIGDLVIGKQMGAYTSASSTRFNSLETAEIVVINGPSVGLNTIFITHSS
jgi:ornithine decarboxylase